MKWELSRIKKKEKLENVEAESHHTIKSHNTFKSHEKREILGSIYKSVSRDMELDQDNRKIFFKQKYPFYCLFVLAKRLYPVEQFFHLMYNDYNPYVAYRHCCFCNESFTPGEPVHWNKHCSDRKFPHYFHIACMDILFNYYDSNVEIVPEAVNLNPRIFCMTCQTNASNKL